MLLAVVLLCVREALKLDRQYVGSRYVNLAEAKADDMRKAMGLFEGTKSRCLRLWVSRQRGQQAVAVCGLKVPCPCPGGTVPYLATCVESGVRALHNAPAV